MISALSSRKRVSLLSAVALTTAASVLVGSPAAANPAAEKRMLKQKDVPASFGTPTSYDFDAKIIDKTIGICDDANGQTLASVPAPPTQYVVDIETKNKKTYTEVFERVYRFGSADQAKAAFDQLNSQLATCDGSSSMTSSTPSLAQTNTTGSYNDAVTDNFWINNAGTWSGGELKKPSRTVLQAIYMQAGDAIIETGAYINGRSRLTPRQSADLLTTANFLTCQFAPPFQRPPGCAR
jgi:hypothetical protein